MLAEIENDKFLKNMPEHFKIDLERVLKYDRKTSNLHDEKKEGQVTTFHFSYKKKEKFKRDF